MKKPFRVWSSKLLTDVYAVSEQFRTQIEALYTNLDAVSLKDMPHSMVPTDTLYELVSGLGILYEAALGSDLLNTGNKKQDYSKLH
jgi:hypothetical protein